MRSRLACAVVVLSLPLFVGFDCGSGGSSGSPGAGASVTWSHGRAVVTVHAEPFGLTIARADGAVLLESAPLDASRAEADPLRAYAPLAMTHNEDASAPTFMYGWSYFHGDDDPWKTAERATWFEQSDARLVAHVATSDPAHPAFTLTVSAADAEPGGATGVRIEVAPDAIDPALNRVSLGFALHDDDHFFGFGERFVRSDHRGQLLYSWVEDGGFGHGEDTPPGPSNPSPSGEGQTNIPIPWFMSPRGFGMLLDTTYRSNFHLGDESATAWRVESTSGRLDATVFVDDDPNALVASLTALTGRPPEIADWVLAPRRRANPGTDEVAKLRAAHVPTSVIDESVHYFPNGAPKELAGAAMKALTADLHARGFKAIAYFCPFVADSFHPVFDEAVARGYLVKKPGGAPYLVLDTPYNAGMVDFTNPDAVAWYQSFLQGALDDGWDGWMYDFAEYVPQDAVMFDGSTGLEAHNRYPVLYQKAAFDLLERQRKKDYLVFVRSGYAGTGGLVPMVWAGDQSTDFDRADGLPAALTGALNAGMSGLPLWGSDISGYHFVFNPPPDKEVYLRWTELGAFSADMHDENEGSGQGATNADRWQIWKDQETLDVYRRYASLKTRMLPYVRVAVRQARARGTPVMRHLYLDHPTDARVYGITDEYMYGDALLVAPVVDRGLRSRRVYLPDAAYFDFWTGARVAGRGEVTADAPLDVAPVFARLGAIVPMLAADVETVVPSADGSVVSMADRKDFLEVAVFAGGTSDLALDDGTTLGQTAPEEAFVPGAVTREAGAIPTAASEADLATCAACALDDPAAHLLRVALTLGGPNDTVTAGALSLRIRGSGSVKRYLFSVRY
jgi:alpha-glucosidase